MATTVKSTMLTPEFRMSFPNLVTAKAFKGSNGKEKGEPSFNTEMIFDAENLDKFQKPDASGNLAAVDVKQEGVALARQKWGDINMQEAFAKTWFVKDGAALIAKQEAKGKTQIEHYRGKKVLYAKANQDYPPNLYVIENGKKRALARGLEADMAKAKQLFVGGNYAVAEINLVPVEVDEKKYIACYVNSICFTRPGDRIGGQSLMERFDGIKGGKAAHDPTSKGSDDIPF